MKKSFIILLSAISVIACNPGADNSAADDQMDTIQTASGLQYYYLKKGEGRKVEPKSIIKSYLSLMVDDSVVWNTNESPDSVFSFIVGVDGVIAGFEEMALLMREGDDVVAILPPELAYGERGAGEVIPPNATLVYDRFEVRSVSEPKMLMKDSLIHALSEGMDSMIEKFKQITTTADSTNYHLIDKAGEAFRTWSQLREDERYEEAYQVMEYFEEELPWSGMEWSRTLNLENLERYDEAIKVLEGIMETDSSGWTGYTEKMTTLKEKSTTQK